MLFNSITFLIFFVAVTAAYFILPPKFRWILLLTASSFFYMFFVPVYIFILLFLILLDYYAAIIIENASNEKHKKWWLTISLIGNVGMLAFFKYYNFLNDNIGEALSAFGWHNPIPYLNIILPIGLSFHTFQSMSYTIEVYRGKVKAEKHLGIYALYVMFYPQLVAGPIERANTLLPQLKLNNNKLQFDNFMIGISQMLWGLFKKVVVADSLALYVDSIYNNYHFNHGFTLVFATWMFAFQIYCDFSGYSDIAIGAGRVMGYTMMTNFTLPYFSKSITEFWRRWHMSLSSWLRDYLYIALGGNRKGKIRTYINLFLTMLLGGLWHGASWNFVIWGGLNGSYLAIEKSLKINFNKSNFSFLLKMFYAFIVFNLISFTWIFFRSHSFEQTTGILTGMFSISNWFNLRIQDTSIFTNMIGVLMLMLAIEYFVFRKKTFSTLYHERPVYYLTAFNFAMVLFVLLFGVTGDQFIYFQF